MSLAEVNNTSVSAALPSLRSYVENSNTKLTKRQVRVAEMIKTQKAEMAQSPLFNESSSFSLRKQSLPA